MPPSLNMIAVRPEQPQDEVFLFELYASTRQEELDAWNWPPEMRSAFLTLQFKASQGYRQAFPDAEFQIVQFNGVKAGRMIVHRTPEELRIVNIALLPQFRNSGIGSALLQKNFDEAAATKKPLRLRVLKGSRAVRFYERLGFVKTGETELHLEMTWRASAAPGIESIMPHAVKPPPQLDAARLQAKQELMDKIIEFLRDIGLKIRAGKVENGAVLPGITVEDGVLVYDSTSLQFPGDLLHEAGHLAVKLPADRKLAGINLGADPAEEMMAISWSYAAILHLQLPSEVVFHPAGYRGGSQSLLDNFAAGRYLAIPMLQWLGMTYDEKLAREIGAAPYPKMQKWLRES